jgi:nicotinamidase-related amidase
MKFLRKHIVFRSFWLLMALHILNCSIDTPDAQPDSIPENLSYNDIETISELVLEQILGFENAIAEHDEHDTDDAGSFQIAKIILYYQSPTNFSIKHTHYFSYSNLLPILYEAIFITQFHPEIVAPPPQQV